MVTWFKRVVLCFVVFCVTTLTAIMIGRLVMPHFGYDVSLDAARKVGWALSPLFILLYVRTWKKSDFAPVVPPLPPQALENPPMSLFTKLRWVVGVAVGMWFAVAVIQSWTKKSVTASQPGSRAFHEANLLLTGSRNGIKHGNTPKAKELAGRFSERLKEARQQGVTARKSPALVSLTGGEFLSYCHLTDDHCVFLVHVPDLRNFTVGAKDFIAEAALATAMELAAESGANAAKVAVGIRGALFYDRAVSANRGSVKGNEESESFLVGYFAPRAASKTAAQTAAVSAKAKQSAAMVSR